MPGTRAAQYDLQIHHSDENKLDEAISIVTEALEKAYDLKLIEDYYFDYDEDTSNWLNEEPNDE